MNLKDKFKINNIFINEVKNFIYYHFINKIQLIEKFF